MMIEWDYEDVGVWAFGVMVTFRRSRFQPGVLIAFGPLSVFIARKP